MTQLAAATDDYNLLTEDNTTDTCGLTGLHDLSQMNSFITDT